MTTRYSNFRLEIGSVTLNSNLHAGQSFYMLDNIPEILSTLSVRSDDTERQGDHGAEDGLSFYGPRTIPVSGELHAVDSATRFTMEQALRSELALPIAQDFAGEDGYLLVLITDQDGTEKQLYAKIIVPPSFELLPGTRERSCRFRFSLYAKDPKIYGQDVETATQTESYASTTFTFQDGDLPTFQDTDLPTVQDIVGDSMTVTVSGTYGTPPLIIVYGPVENPTVSNVTTGRSMTLDGLTLLTGERVEIDVAALPKSITKIVSGVETDASGYLTNDSDWIFLSPGANVLTLTDDSPGVLSGGLELQWRPTWI